MVMSGHDCRKWKSRTRDQSLGGGLIFRPSGVQRVCLVGASAGRSRDLEVASSDFWLQTINVILFHNSFCHSC
jgi:hypothetical protein